MTRQRAADRRTKRQRDPQPRTRARRHAATNGNTRRTELHRFTVEKPFCTPCRSILIPLAEKYEIPMYNYEEGVNKISLREVAKRMRVELKTFENLKYGNAAVVYLPMSCWATFDVPAARARWFEDIIHYSRRCYVTKGTIDPKSFDRGWKGEIRHAWKEQPGYRGRVGTGGIRGSGPQVEATCKQGKDLWDQVSKLAKGAKNGKR